MAKPSDIWRIALSPFYLALSLALGLLQEFFLWLLLGAAFLWLPATILYAQVGFDWPFNLIYWLATALVAATLLAQAWPWLSQFGAPPQAAKLLAAGLPAGPLPPPEQLQSSFSFAQVELPPGTELVFRLQPDGPALASGVVEGDFTLRIEGQITTLETATLACLSRQGIQRRHCRASAYWYHAGRSLKSLYDDKTSFDWF